MSHLNALLSQMERSEEDSKQRSVHLFYLYFRVDFAVLSLSPILLVFCSSSLYPSIFVFSLVMNLIWDFSRSLSAIVFFFLFSSTNINLIILYLTLLIWSDLIWAPLISLYTLLLYFIRSYQILFYTILLYIYLFLLKSHLSLYLFFIPFINFHNSFLSASSIFFSCFFLYHRLQTSFLSLHYIFTYIYVYSYIHSNIYIYNHF